MIKGLLDGQGNMREDSDTMCNIVHNYFEHLFTTEVVASELTIFKVVARKVNSDMNGDLLAAFTYEVKQALFQIGDLNAPGLDGLHAVFYKRFWDLLGDDLMKEVLEAVNNEHIPEG